MKKALVLLAALLPLAAGPALAKNDKAGMDKAAKAVGEPRQPKAGRGGDDANNKGGMSYDHRRDGRGEADNPGGGKAKGRNKAGKTNQ